MLLTLLGLTSFLSLKIGLNHGLHKGHTPVAPKLFVGLLGLRGLTCCCHKGLTIAIIAMAVHGVVGMVEVTMGFATLTNFSLQAFLGTQPLEPPDTFLLELLLASGWAAVVLSFALSFSFCFSTITT
jgi:hypothetical protein